MHSGMIGKVEKARRYSRERDRLRFSQLTVSIDGDNGVHEVRFEDGSWECRCDFFAHRRTCAHVMTLELVLEGMLPQEAAVA